MTDDRTHNKIYTKSIRDPGGYVLRVSHSVPIAGQGRAKQWIGISIEIPESQSLDAVRAAFNLPEDFQFPERRMELPIITEIHQPQEKLQPLRDSGLFSATTLHKVEQCCLRIANSQGINYGRS